MKINEILNPELQRPQIKVDVRSKTATGNGRTLIRVDIDTKNAISQLNQIVKKISDKFIDSETTIKVINTDPLIFNLIPRDGMDLYQFTVSITPSLQSLQKDFMMSRGITLDRP